jgi:hypothetical protein
MNAIRTEANHHDDGLEWLREIRRRISAVHGHDQHKIGGAIRAYEKSLGDRVVRTQPRLVPVGDSDGKSPRDCSRR